MVARDLSQGVAVEIVVATEAGEIAAAVAGIAGGRKPGRVPQTGQTKQEAHAAL